jgi:hypothetical protein
VYVLDIDSHSAWFKWQPSVVLEHNSEIDLSANELTLRGNSFPVSKGFCWVDLQTLIEECLAVDVNVSSNQYYYIQCAIVLGCSALFYTTC